MRQPRPARVRPTFLLQVAVLLLVLLPGVGACVLALHLGSGGFFLAALGAGLGLVVLSGDIAQGLVWLLARRAAGREIRDSALWVVESEESREEERRAFLDATRDNPTLR